MPYDIVHREMCSHGVRMSETHYIHFDANQPRRVRPAMGIMAAYGTSDAYAIEQSSPGCARLYLSGYEADSSSDEEGYTARLITLPESSAITSYTGQRLLEYPTSGTATMSTRSSALSRSQSVRSRPASSQRNTALSRTQSVRSSNTSGATRSAAPSFSRTQSFRSSCNHGSTTSRLGSTTQDSLALTRDRLQTRQTHQSSTSRAPPSAASRYPGLITPSSGTSRTQSSSTTRGHSTVTSSTTSRRLPSTTQSTTSRHSGTPNTHSRRHVGL